MILDLKPGLYAEAFGGFEFVEYKVIVGLINRELQIDIQTDTNRQTERHRECVLLCACMWERL